MGRALKEEIKIIDTVDRLSKNLTNIYKYLDTIWSNHHKLIKPKIKPGSIGAIDFSDVVKPQGKKFEDLCRVTDGSDEHKTKPGYWVAEAAVLINNRVVSLYSHIFSTVSKGFKSINTEMFNILDKVFKSFGNAITIVMDRGFDDQKYLKYFTEKFWGFIVRVSHEDRIVECNGVKTKLYKLADNFKGKYSATINIKGKQHRIKCSFAKINVCGVKQELTVVFVYFNKNTSMFITNTEVLGKSTCLRIVYSYYMRWRIEEYFKYKKSSFKFEKFMVRDLNRINSLNTLLSMALCAIELMTRHKSKLVTFALKEARVVKDMVFMIIIV